MSWKVMFNNLDRATSEIGGGQRSNRKTASSTIASNVSGNRQSATKCSLPFLPQEKWWSSH